jgi:hypothetical protein
MTEVLSDKSQVVRILALGDQHVKVSEIEETDLMFQEVYRIIDEVKPDLTAMMGDINDTHERIHMNVLSRSTKFASTVNDKSNSTAFLIGNHDRENNSDFLTEEHSFNALKKWPKMHVVDKPLRLTIKGQDFVFVPYVAPGKFKEALDTLENKDLSNITAIFAHQEFKGCTMGAIKSTQGDVWDEKLPPVISGHIHTYERLQSNIYYVGSARQVGFGDKSAKSISEFIFDGHEVKEIRHYLKCKTKHIIHLDVKQAETYEPPKDSIIKLIVSGSAAELHVFKKHSASRFESLSVKLQYKVIEVKKSPNITGNYVNQQYNSQSYTERLYSAIKDNSDLKRAYEEL